MAEGHVVLLRLPFEGESLHPDEAALIANASAPSRRAAFIGGRAALRRALRHYSVEHAPIMKDDRGAPCLPPGYVGSISHKDKFAVAVASPADGFTRGIDVELLRKPKTDISSRVLRDEELALASGFTDEEATHALLLRFSIKEAVYKAIDPHLRRYVDYRECAAWPAPTGETRVELFVHDNEPRLECHARWFEVDGHVVAIARARVI